ncbi:protein phosphatase 2C domain-containing protein [Streptomyces sp. NPDC051636]|uniref:protein phosphatase 2C domain-containing protein n=1 Tax=Streptomyces sp. NPDC051636 TaxID=3365663 RepID=UPI00379A0728
MALFPHRRSDDDRGERRRVPPPGPAPDLYPKEPAEPGPAPEPGGAYPAPGEPYVHQQGTQNWPPGVLSVRTQAPAPPRGELADAWRPISVDGAVPDFDPRPPTGGLSYRPDTICDGWSTSALDLRLASVRGYAHRAEGRPREDDAAAAWDELTGTVVFAVADGVSDAREPHIGSQLACRSAVDELLSQVRAGGGFVTDWHKLLSTVHWQLVEQARRILRVQDTPSVDDTAALLATTLVAGAATPTSQGVHVALVSVGDSGVWAIKNHEVYPLKGGKSFGADGLLSPAVRPMPYVPADIAPFEYVPDPDSVLLVGTDGFGDPVGDGRGAVARLCAQELARPLPPLAFAYTLDFYRETFDDDRTLLALWPRRGAPGAAR